MRDSVKLSPSRRRYLFWVSCFVLVMGAAVTGALTGLILTWGFELPQVGQLNEKKPDIISHVYSSDGHILGEFALERRLIITYDQIPEVLKKSILAAEDANFFQHAGIDFLRLFNTIYRDIVYGERKGASTITMQLSKLLLTSPKITLERKIQDMIFAIQIERTLSKEQIFTRYCNQMYMGHGRYGLAAAAEFFFQKTMGELEFHEAALLAGVIRAPEKYSPLNHPERALKRRNWVLNRAYIEGFIGTGTLGRSLQEPLDLKTRSHGQNSAAYFVEWVRQYLEKRYPSEIIHKGGLRIYTTLDHGLQTASEKALQNGLKEFDKKRRRWTGATENILEAGKDPDQYWHPDWDAIFAPGQLVHGLVLKSNEKRAQIRVGSYRAVVKRKHLSWTGKQRVDQVLKPGDLCTFTLGTIDRTDRVLELNLDRIPEIQGALLAIENESGAIRAMVGGFDFRYSKFNRSTQALRQPGSVFKPFTYVTAVENGYSPYDTVQDTPVEFFDGLGRPYNPKNVDGKFKGLISIEQALYESRNVPTIQLANALGIDKIIDVAYRFGIQQELPPYLPTALGAGEVTLKEITSAFTVFPNRGVLIQPYFVERVEDFHGVLLEHHEPKLEEVATTEIADTLVYLLRQVVQKGTAVRARKLQIPVAGKTGTTNDSTDSWFVGFSTLMTTGVWVGHDTKKSLGEKVYGSNLALPIWIDFMESTSEKTPPGDFKFETGFFASRQRESLPPTSTNPNLAETPRDGVENFPESSTTPEPDTNIVVEDIPPPKL